MMNERDPMNRRAFLKALAGAAAVSAAGLTGGTALGRLFGSSRADDEESEDLKYDLVLPRLKFECVEDVPDPWNISPGGDRNLLLELAKVVRCKVRMPAKPSDYDPYTGNEAHFSSVVDFRNGDEVMRYPFLFMTAEGHFEFDKTQKEGLKEYVQRGGFVLMDDCVFNGAGDFFYESSHRVLEEVFGRGSVIAVPKEHEIFHNVYDFGDAGVPHMHGVQHGARGVFIDKRLAVLLTSSDIHCGWADRLGKWFGMPKVEKSLQFGVNMVMYALAH